MKRKGVYIYIILIIIFMLIQIISSPDLDSKFSMFRVPIFQREMMQMALLIAFFYFNYVVLIPKLFNQKKYFLFAISVFACFFLIAILPQILILTSGYPVPPIPPNGQNEFPFF
ncbi:hypothetical protein [uncultured Chryseobacterium sp.]|uniref:hypothetical protein n=1 Tax=uncultured Chryseobacterium sp. TaxID=259322 RepID=UPI00262D2F12|nr:hypothetical protein [uncultured Chryseobacterium sp.]